MAQRLDELTSPVVVGKKYIVPTLGWCRWNGVLGYWPIWEPAHADPEFFNEPNIHYHLDARFIPPSKAARLVREYLSRKPVMTGTPDALIFGVAMLNAVRVEVVQRCPIEWRKLKCWRQGVAFSFEIGSSFLKLRNHFSGCKLARNEKGQIVCPHRGAVLSNVAPVNGVLICPLHGLRFNEEGVAL